MIYHSKNSFVSAMSVSKKRRVADVELMEKAERFVFGFTVVIKRTAGLVPASFHRFRNCPAMLPYR